MAGCVVNGQRQAKPGGSLPRNRQGRIASGYENRRRLEAPSLGNNFLDIAGCIGSHKPHPIGPPRRREGISPADGLGADGCIVGYDEHPPGMPWDCWQANSLWQRACLVWPVMKAHHTSRLVATHLLGGDPRWTHRWWSGSLGCSTRGRGTRLPRHIGDDDRARSPRRSAGWQESAGRRGRLRAALHASR